jgi:hypothetical protein
MDRMPNKDLPDTTADKDAAEQQARKIKAYWAAKGQDVNVWVELDRRCALPIPLYVVRSDILTVRRRVA